jgi:hypothetical protein
MNCWRQEFHFSRLVILTDCEPAWMFSGCRFEAIMFSGRSLHLGSGIIGAQDHDCPRDQRSDVVKPWDLNCPTILHANRERRSLEGLVREVGRERPHPLRRAVSQTDASLSNWLS